LWVVMHTACRMFWNFKTYVNDGLFSWWRTSDKKQRMTVRLLRICNPWGKREWKGEWSVNSEKWTTALRNKLGKQSFAKGDGTFFMAFGDVLHSFHHMDVAKCHQVSKRIDKCTDVELIYSFLLIILCDARGGSTLRLMECIHVKRRTHWYPHNKSIA
jgi:hypothetical protein